MEPKASTTGTIIDTVIDMTSCLLPPPPTAWLQLLAACLTAVLIPPSSPAHGGAALDQPGAGRRTPVQLNWILNDTSWPPNIIMVSGSLTDRYGPRRILAGQAGLVLRLHLSDRLGAVGRLDRLPAN